MYLQSSDKDAKTKLSELEDQEKKWREKEEELKKKEKVVN